MASGRRRARCRVVGRAQQCTTLGFSLLGFLAVCVRRFTYEKKWRCKARRLLVLTHPSPLVVFPGIPWCVHYHTPSDVAVLPTGHQRTFNVGRGESSTSRHPCSLSRISLLPRSLVHTTTTCLHATTTESIAPSLHADEVCLGKADKSVSRVHAELSVKPAAGSVATRLSVKVRGVRMVCSPTLQHPPPPHRNFQLCLCPCGHACLCVCLSFLMAQPTLHTPSPQRIALHTARW